MALWMSTTVSPTASRRGDLGEEVASKPSFGALRHS